MSEENQSKINKIINDVNTSRLFDYEAQLVVYRMLMDKNYEYVKIGDDTGKLKIQLSMIENYESRMKTFLELYDKIYVYSEGQEYVNPIGNYENIESRQEKILSSNMSDKKVGAKNDSFGGATDAANTNKDPLILDLNHNNKFTCSQEEGVYFDFDGDGFAEKTSWIDQGDGLLVYDRNNNGIIDDGKELFGDKTVMSNGKVASNGFEALSDLDTNNDGIIDYKDEHFNDIKVWIDSNNDGITDGGELKSLKELGINSISLNFDNKNNSDNDSIVTGIIRL